MARPKIVLGTLRDSHSVGILVLKYVLQNDFDVVNLGTLVDQEEFISAAIETNARAILVSSLYGHGEIDCQGFRQKCTEAGLGDIILYVGGNLVVGAKRSWKRVESTFKKMGFNRVYPQTVQLEQVLADLKKDLGVA
ncbi:MAG: methylaspartate mutase subunit S [Chloroflexi bacterium]|nr:methylaspartate mutase subunit S [Chloroflexota bacterium]